MKKITIDVPDDFSGYGLMMDGKFYESVKESGCKGCDLRRICDECMGFSPCDLFDNYAGWGVLRRRDVIEQ